MIIKIIPNIITKSIILNYLLNKRSYEYKKKYAKYSFVGNKCTDNIQYEAIITRWYHTIEKGLSYRDFRCGFGKRNINNLLEAMENYIKAGYSEETFFYKTALCVLDEYIHKNKECGYYDEELVNRVSALKGSKNEFGGSVEFTPLSESDISNANYYNFITSRRSIRDFSDIDVDVERVQSAIELAQYTPSACNRQGWRTRLICDKDMVKHVLDNQNGSEGFKDKINKLILVTGDIRYFNRDRELHQVFIDGGMYAQSILNALHYKHIATIPLSAALNLRQEKNVRNILDVDKAEVFIMFIGIGNYPDVCCTARSQRHNARIEIF